MILMNANYINKESQNTQCYSAISGEWVILSTFSLIDVLISKTSELKIV